LQLFSESSQVFYHYLQRDKVSLQEFFHFFAVSLSLFAGGLGAFAGFLPVFAEGYRTFALLEPVPFTRHHR
jgi:hypothetical protein